MVLLKMRLRLFRLQGATTVIMSIIVLGKIGVDEIYELNWRAVVPKSLNSFEAVITFRDMDCHTCILS